MSSTHTLKGNTNNDFSYCRTHRNAQHLDNIRMKFNSVPTNLVFNHGFVCELQYNVQAVIVFDWEPNSRKMSWFVEQQQVTMTAHQILPCGWSSRPNATTCSFYGVASSLGLRRCLFPCKNYHPTVIEETTNIWRIAFSRDTQAQTCTLTQQCYSEYTHVLLSTFWSQRVYMYVNGQHHTRTIEV